MQTSTRHDVSPRVAALMIVLARTLNLGRAKEAQAIRPRGVGPSAGFRHRPHLERDGMHAWRQGVDPHRVRFDADVHEPRRQMPDPIRLHHVREAPRRATQPSGPHGIDEWADIRAWRSVHRSAPDAAPVIDVGGDSRRSAPNASIVDRPSMCRDPLRTIRSGIERNRVKPRLHP